MEPKPLTRPTERKGLFLRRPYGIADNYRIYQHHDDGSKLNLLTIIVALLSPIITMLSGKSAKSILIEKGQTQLVPLFETLYETQLLHRQSPDALIRAYLPQIAENKLPVSLYRVLDHGITRRATGTLIQDADERYRLQNDHPLSDRFNIAAVKHIFTTPKWVGERVCIVVEA